jgi:hypothetical protein
MARRFVLDDRRPTSVVSQGIYLVIKTDLTVAKREVSTYYQISHYFRDVPHFGDILEEGDERRDNKK